MSQQAREAGHFTKLYQETGHTWWGNLTAAGQYRNDRRITLLKERFALSPSTRILEVGCGRGEYTRRLARLGCRITAIDITPVLIESARREIPEPNVRFEVQDAMNPDYPEKSFDIIFGKSILHHLDYRRALASYRGLLVPGGQVFFSEPNMLNPIVFAGLHFAPLRRRMEFSDDETAFIRGDLCRALKDLGYEQIIVKHFDFLHPSTPASFMPFVDRIGRVIERLPGLRALSGSLLITAAAPR